MPRAIHFRIAGQLATLGLHGVNSFVMIRSTFDQTVMRDPQINDMVSMQVTYLTVWNIFFQMTYATLGLVCDVSTELNREKLVPRPIRKLRQTMFDSSVFPITVLIFIFFWPLFLYDRNIIFPGFIDNIFSLKSNMVMHFWILPLACWEAIFLPRTKPKSHLINVLIITLYFVTYKTVVLHMYFRKGLWPYPLLKLLYGTVYYPLFIIYMYFMTLLCYYKQWSLNTFISGIKMRKLK